VVEREDAHRTRRSIVAVVDDGEDEVGLLPALEDAVAAVLDDEVDNGEMGGVEGHGEGRRPLVSVGVGDEHVEHGHMLVHHTRNDVKGEAGQRQGAVGVDVASGFGAVCDCHPRIDRADGHHDVRGGLDAHIGQVELEVDALPLVDVAVVVSRGVEGRVAAAQDVGTIGRNGLHHRLVGNGVVGRARDHVVSRDGDGLGQFDGGDAILHKARTENLVPLGEGHVGALHGATDLDGRGAEEVDLLVGQGEGLREGRAEHDRRITEDAPGVHHLFSPATVAVDHTGAAVGHNGAEGVADLHLAVFDHEIGHLVLTPHGRCPALEHAGEGAADAAGRFSVGRVLDPHLTEAVAGPFAFVEVPNAAGHRHEEAVHAVVGGLADGVDVEAAGGNATVVPVAGVVDEGQPLVDQLDHVVGVGVAGLVCGLPTGWTVAPLAAVIELPDLLEVVVDELVLDGVEVLPIAFAVVADAGALVGPDAHGDVEPLLAEERILLVLQGAFDQRLHLVHVVHEQAADKEFRVVVVPLHIGVARVAVSGATTIGHEGGRHLVLIAREDHMGQSFVEVLVGEEVLDGLVVISEVISIHDLRLETLLDFPLDERRKHIVVHRIRDHDNLAVLLDVVVPVLTVCGIEESALELVGKFRRDPGRGRRRIDRCSLRLYNAHGDGRVGAQDPGHRVVLEREGPDALAPNAALDEGGP